MGERLKYQPAFDFQIKQIIPETGGATAVFLLEGKDIEFDVICWALVERFDDKDESRYEDVVGMVFLEGSESLDFVVEGMGAGQFLRYVRPAKSR